MNDFDPDRRKVLMVGGAALTVGLAGCSGGGDDNGGDNGNESSNGGDNGGDATPEEAVDTYLTDNDANGYDGMDSIMDMTGQDEVNITVGPNGNFQMEPAAARISEGTTVVWTWDSAGHSVSYREGPTDDEFNDGGASASAGRTFEHTFENGTGEVLYRCNPHAAQGHYAALIVE
jgi:halocyanin-like protein